MLDRKLKNLLDTTSPNYMGCGYKECDPYKKNGNKEHFSAAEGEALKLFPPFQNSTCLSGLYHH